MADDDDSHGFPLVLHGDADPTSTGGVAVCGFSTVGMVGGIAASNIVSALDLKQLGTVIDRRFPPMALVHDEVPKHPVRVYQGDGLGVFTSEIQFPAETDVKFAETVLEWFTEGGFDRLFIIDGIVSSDLGEKDSGDIHGVAATEEGRNRLRAAGIEPMQQGIVSGIAGWLLSEANRLNLDVTALLAECNPMYPDARAAAVATEAFSEVADIEVPLDSLLEDARQIEENVRQMFEKSQQMLPAPDDVEFQVRDGDDPMIG